MHFIESHGHIIKISQQTLIWTLLVLIHSCISWAYYFSKFGPFCFCNIFTPYFIEDKPAQKSHQKPPLIQGEVKERVSSAASCVTVQVREEKQSFLASAIVRHLDVISQQGHGHLSEHTNNMQMNKTVYLWQCFYTSTTVMCAISYKLAHNSISFDSKWVKERMCGPHAPAQANLGSVTQPQTAASSTQVKKNPSSITATPL